MLRVEDERERGEGRAGRLISADRGVLQAERRGGGPGGGGTGTTVGGRAWIPSSWESGVKG